VACAGHMCALMEAECQPQSKHLEPKHIRTSCSQPFWWSMRKPVSSKPRYSLLLHIPAEEVSSHTFALTMQFLVGTAFVLVGEQPTLIGLAGVVSCGGMRACV